MNKRFTELAKQAGLQQTKWADADTEDERVRIWQESLNNPGSLEKFAELLVKECAETINDGTNPSIFYQTLMLRHFGVSSMKCNECAEYGSAFCKDCKVVEE